MMDLNHKRVMISRTDGIGDVCLAMPIFFLLRKKFPYATLIFLGRTYTQQIGQLFEMADEFINMDDMNNLKHVERVQIIKSRNIDVVFHIFPKEKIATMCSDAKIPLRIGTSHRHYHWLNCNCFLHFSRKDSNMHESQLNLLLFGKHLKPEEIDLSLQELAALIERPNLQDFQKDLFTRLEVPAGKYFILHPFSKGSAVEWPIENYVELADALIEKGFNVFVTGTEPEGLSFRKSFNWQKEGLYDLSGKLNLKELCATVSQAHGLVACSTGPAHIAGIFGVHTYVIFSKKRPIHAQRWQPLGENVHVIESELGSDKNPSEEMQSILVFDVLKNIEEH